ncbi:MAG: hypothetical protein AAGA76_06150 [Pseudomonadota bacterium]
MNAKSTPSCPTCEYERASPGKPVSRDGKMHCLECGNSWKEFSNLVVDVKAPLSLPQEPEAEEGFGQVDPAFPGAANSKSGMTGLMAAIFLLVSGIAGLLAFLQFNVPDGQQKGLHVANIQFEEIIRGNRGKVVQVKGVISNSGAESKALPRLAIILRKSNGNELTRWYYRSPVLQLKPGGESRFVSSIQSDFPVIASVEALFE